MFKSSGVARPIPLLMVAIGDFWRQRASGLPRLREKGFVSYSGVQLISKGQLKGVLEIFHRSSLDTEPEWVNFLEVLAGQAAIAIDNATLFDQLQRANTELITAYDKTLQGWVQALELRHKETKGHSQRVTEMTVPARTGYGNEGRGTRLGTARSTAA